tara:strand:- start:6501 stop:7445 length:945 start_codon:yes stop_codon:yes gene_type:complete
MQYSLYKNLKLNIFNIKLFLTCCVIVSLFLMLLCFSYIGSARANELSIYVSESPAFDNTLETRPDQLPLSRLAYGQRNIIRAWFANPTNRYAHNVLGDSLEASKLIVETFKGNRLTVNLPENRVFEDLEPRIIDVNGDGSDEIIVIESDIALGASLAVYSIIDSHLVKIASTSFIGTPYRWLNPVGVGDFDGDGHTDIAAVITPHIGGLLRLYHLTGNHLSQFAEYSGVSTHGIGSTELGLGRVISATPRDLLLLPNRTRQALMLLEWTATGWSERGRVVLPGRMQSSLVFVKLDRWRFQLDTGAFYEVQFTGQ